VQPSQQRQLLPPFLPQFALGSYSGFGSDCCVDHWKRKSFVAVDYGANGSDLGSGSGFGFDFWTGGRCIWDHHRTLLRLVHSLYFCACYGCAQ